MKLKFRASSTWLLAEAAINIILITILTMYYKLCTVPEFLVGVLNVDLGKFTLIQNLYILLIVFLVLEIILFFVSLIENKYKYVKWSAVIVAIVFAVLLPITFLTLNMGMQSKELDNNILCKADVFDGDDAEVYYTYEENKFGRVANLHQDLYVSDEYDESTLSDSTANFVCIYRKSDKPEIKEKFVRYGDEINDFTMEENVVEKDGYTLYYTDADDSKGYALKIENDEVYYVAMFDTWGDKAKTDYSPDDFVKDSLNTFEYFNQ